MGEPNLEWTVTAKSAPGGGMLASFVLHGALFLAVIGLTPNVPTFQKIEAFELVELIKGPSTPDPIRQQPASRPSLSEAQPSSTKKSAEQTSPVEPTSTESQASSGNSQKSQVASSEMETYINMIHRMVEERKHYPRAARILKQTGKVEVAFEVAANGRIENTKLVNGSPFQSLNDEALRAVNSLEQIAPIPESFHQNRMQVRMTIVFELR